LCPSRTSVSSFKERNLKLAWDERYRILLARQRFRDAATRLGWQLEAYPIDAGGPAGEELTIDVAIFDGEDPRRTFVVSSGIHGVEAFFGSAVQLALLENWSARSGPTSRCLFLHALNPFGFAWLRRFDEKNVDLNRNFLLPGDAFAGCHEAYAQLDGLLNPRRPPSPWEPFMLKALWTIARHGMPTLQQAVAGGQYEFPKGLFFGGAGPSQTQEIVRGNLHRWLAGSESVVHLDFHTGLGPHATYQLLIDQPLTANQHAWLSKWIGTDSFDPGDASSRNYDARGGFGPWCIAQDLAADYLFACAEFGTFSPVQVLAGLRAENQAHHWGSPSSTSTARAKRRLKELFCPSSSAWRTQVVNQSLELAARSVRGLEGLASSDRPL
jgi:hypothetical protein